MPQLSMHSPVGDLTISAEDGHIVSLDWGWSARQSSEPLLIAAREELEAYFDGGASPFDLPLAPRGSEFQRRVWARLVRIGFGRTVTYGHLATELQTASRAVGMACARNPIPLLIPCHRVVAANGHLGGYSGQGGVDTKIALLRLEGAYL